MKCLSLLLISVLASSCATLFGDKDRSIRVDSTPSGAIVRLNGMPFGKTPATVQVSSMLSSNYIEISKAGYETVTLPISTSIQPIAFLNLLNLLCWGIDLATGNVMKLDTKMISVDLERKTAIFKGLDGQVTIAATSGLQCQCVR